MALDNKKVISLSAESMVAGKPVVRFSSTITSDALVNSSYNEQILDAEAYKANKTEVRADMAAFRELVYDLEDEMAAPVLPEE